MITKFDMAEEAYIKVCIRGVSKTANYERYQCALTDHDDRYIYDDGACYEFDSNILMTKEEMQNKLQGISYETFPLI